MFTTFDRLRPAALSSADFLSSSPNFQGRCFSARPEIQALLADRPRVLPIYFRSQGAGGIKTLSACIAGPVGKHTHLSASFRNLFFHVARASALEKVSRNSGWGGVARADLE